MNKTLITHWLLYVGNRMVICAYHILITANVSTNFNVFNNPSMFSYVLLMFSNSLKMIKIDRNMSQSWQIMCKMYNFNIIAFVGFVVWIVYRCTDMSNYNIDEALCSLRPRYLSTSFWRPCTIRLITYLYHLSLPIAFCAETDNEL
jgi:hypothetical protein